MLIIKYLELKGKDLQKRKSSEFIGQTIKTSIKWKENGEELEWNYKDSTKQRSAESVWRYNEQITYVLFWVHASVFNRSPCRTIIINSPHLYELTQNCSMKSFHGFFSFERLKIVLNTCLNVRCYTHLLYHITTNHLAPCSVLVHLSKQDYFRVNSIYVRTTERN